MADFWEDDEPAAVPTGDRSDTRGGGPAREPRSFHRYHEDLDDADIITHLRAVRDQLVGAAPVAYERLIGLIDSYAGDQQVDSDDVIIAAMVVINGTRHVKGGAIEDLRVLMGSDGQS